MAHLFRPVLPYAVAPGSVIHNKLRLARIHFGQARIDAVTGALSAGEEFDAALASVAERDIAGRRAELSRRRCREDDWLFERFAAFDDE